MNLRLRFLPVLGLALFSATALAAERARYVEGEVIVTFKPATGLPAAEGALAGRALKMAKHFDFLSVRRGRHTGLVREKTRTTAQLIAALRADPTVESVEPNYLRWTTGAPNDGFFSLLWGLKNTGQQANGAGGTAGADVKFLPAWDLARPTPGPVVLGVIDTGVTSNHPDLAPNMWVNPGEVAGNGVDDDGNGYADDVNGFNFDAGTGNPSDSGSHGTHVAGTIGAAGNNGLGVIGVAYKSSIMALRVSADGNSINTAAELAAIEYATMMKLRGVNIVALNASYGGPGFSQAERDAIQAAGDAGIIFCAAAGNSAANNDTTATYPANHRLPNMIVVAAFGQADTLASFSNYGATTVDLAAPGVNILSTAPLGVGAGVTTLAVNGQPYGTTAMTFSGTTSGLTGTLYDCGIGNTGEFPAGVNGQTALIARGTLTFAQKVTNAAAAGARAAVIYNNVAGTFNGTLGAAGSWIPVVAIAQADGLAIKAALPSTGVVAVSNDYQFLNGTSMATPHVTGAVGFAAMNFPTDTVAQRMQRILSAVDVKASLSGLVATGGRLNLQRIVDADNNALPDWWEQTYFGALLGSGAGADRDGDGMTNLQEYLAGTVPTNPADRLRVSAVVKNTFTGAFVITWSAVPEKIYQVQYLPALGGTWQVGLPASQLTAGTGQTSLSYTDASATSTGTRFYRVVLVVP